MPLDYEIIYSRADRDYSCFVIIDGVREYIGSAPNYSEGERRCRDYAYDHYADRSTPEVAAQIVMEGV